MRDLSQAIAAHVLCIWRFSQIVCMVHRVLQLLDLRPIVVQPIVGRRIVVALRLRLCVSDLYLLCAGEIDLLFVLLASN